MSNIIIFLILRHRCEKYANLLFPPQFILLYSASFSGTGSSYKPVNDFEITARELAFLYEKGWGIELVFKKIKQTFSLEYFYGGNKIVIRIQAWCTLIARLLLAVSEYSPDHESIFRSSRSCKDPFDQHVGCNQTTKKQQSKAIRSQ